MEASVAATPPPHPRCWKQLLIASCWCELGADLMTLSRMVHKQELRSDLPSIWISSAVRCTFLRPLRWCGRVPPWSQQLLLVALLLLKSNELFPSRYKSPQRVSVAAQYWPTSSLSFFLFFFFFSLFEHLQHKSHAWRNGSLCQRLS